MDEHQAVLHRLKALHTGIKQASNADDSEGFDRSILKEWKSAVAQIHKELSEVRRKAVMEREMQNMTVTIMREEMRDELVEREAVSARTAERFRSFCSQAPQSIQSAFDRAARTAGSIDSCINGLSCDTLKCSGGSAMLHDQVMKDA